MGLGLKLRERRQALGLSLHDVAKDASVSVATLSRIETEKQGLDLTLFMLLGSILDSTPAHLLASANGDEETIDSVMERLTLLGHADRTRLWRRMANDAKARRSGDRRVRPRQLGMMVEEFGAQLELLQAEVQELRNQLRRVNS